MKQFLLSFIAVLAAVFVSGEASAATDVSSTYFSNLDFESCTYSGSNTYAATVPTWSMTYNAANSSSSYSSYWAYLASSDNSLSSSVSGTYLKMWISSSTSLSAGTHLSQTSSSTLPAGTYTISVDAYASKSGLYLFAGDQTAAISTCSSWGTTNNISVSVTLTEATSLSIGIKSTSSISGELNFYCDNFTVVSETASSSSSSVDVSSSFSNLNFDSDSGSTSSVLTSLTGWGSVATSNLSAQSSSYSFMGVLKVNTSASGSSYDAKAKSYMSTNYFVTYLKSKTGGSSTTYTLSAGTHISQSATEMPAGTYTISCTAYASAANLGFYIFASGSTAGEVSTAISSSGSSTPSVTIELEEGETLTIGVKTTSSISSSSSSKYILLDTFAVSYVAPETDDDADDADDDDDEEVEAAETYGFGNLDFESCTWNSSGRVEPLPRSSSRNDDSNLSSSTKSYTNALGAMVDGYMSSSVENYIFQLYNAASNEVSAGQFLWQTVTMEEAGTYVVSAVVHADGYDGFYLFANDQEQAIASLDAWADVVTPSVTVTVEAGEELTIGLKTNEAISTTSDINLYADNFSIVAYVETDDDTSDTSYSSTSTRLLGGDISLVPAYEDAGDVWLDASGNKINTNYSDGMITYLRDVAKFNSMRVRLLVAPSQDSYLATCQDLTYVKALGKRIKDAGLNFLLDIFYSDTWTDVSTQWIPASWSMDKSTSTETIAAKVKSYTTEVINALVDYGAAPDYVQIGNEVSYGMLWDSMSGASTSNIFYLYSTYSAYQTQIERFATILNSAAEGVRESNASTAKIILHSERTGYSSYTLNFYNWVEKAGFTDYDVIGLSYYPAWHGTLTTFQSTLDILTEAFPKKEIQIVETGYYNKEKSTSSSDITSSYCAWDFSSAGQAAYLTDLIELLNTYSNVTGLYYWQPEECGNGANSGGENTVMDNWDCRGFWSLSWKSGTHTLDGADALMTLMTFLIDIEDSADEETDEETDMSSYFQNLDFEDCETGDYNGTEYVSTVPGWSICNDSDNYDETVNYFNTIWGCLIDGWESSLLTSDENNTKRFGVWAASSSTVTAGNILWQSAEVPSGDYTITVIAHADGYDDFYLFAGDEETQISSSDTWSTASKYKVQISLTEQSTLTLGIKAKTDIESSSSEINLYVDNLTVTATNVG